MYNIDKFSLSGFVQCFDGNTGELKWEKANKITNLGRLALLSSISKQDDFAPNTIKTVLIGNGLSYDVDSWISCFALGNCGVANGAIPIAASYDDTTLSSIIPFGSTEIMNADISGKIILSDYLWLKSPEIPEDLSKDSFVYLLSKGNRQLEYDDFEKNIYFKRVAVETKVSMVAQSNIDNSRYNAFSLKTPVVAFSLMIGSKDLIRPASPVDAGTTGTVSELGLYLANIKKVLPGHEAEFSTLVNANCPPIMFSHITFPAEEFIRDDDKSLKFVYYIYA